MHHVASVAQEIDVELVVNHFIPLATEYCIQGLLELYVGADGALECLVSNVMATMWHVCGLVCR